MLLFSTILDVLPSVTPEDFLRLVLEWNAGSKYAENIVSGIEWHGERTIRYGDSQLWLEFAEYPEKQIIAARHEKITAGGVAWDSDFVMNFAEHRLAVRLDRTYSEEALVVDAAFSTPHIISLLIEKNFLAEDGDLPVLRTPIAVGNADREWCEKVFGEDGGIRLPVVFVSKTADNRYPLSISWLASRLKGAAHVLVEDMNSPCEALGDLCGRGEEPYGAVRIFYPSGSVRRRIFRFRSGTANEEIRLEKVIRHVIQYGISQRVDRLYTWSGVTGAVLNHQLEHQIAVRKHAESEKQRAEAEIDEVYETFDETLNELQERVAELTKANEALQYENQGLRAKYASADAVPILYLGDEEEFYPGEIRDMVLGSLEEGISGTDKATRRADVLEDILENNPYNHLSEERRQRIKALFKGYKSLTGVMRQELQDLGFEITDYGKHYKLMYFGDPRYMITVPKTPGDHRSGSNSAALVNKVAF